MFFKSKQKKSRSAILCRTALFAIRLYRLALKFVVSLNFNYEKFVPITHSDMTL